MKQATGDIWKYADDEDVDALCVLTNMTVASSGKLIMGGGQAREAKERFPLLLTEWGAYYKKFGDAGGVVVHDPLRNYVVVSFPTKVNPTNDSDLTLIKRSCAQLVNLADTNDWERIVLPRPGCGLGGLTWADVQPAISPFLDDRFTVITNV
jgi:hypothetical protein